MPKKTPHPHVSWRAGRPRFNPSPELRAKGHASKDLRHPDGRWFSKGECVDWSAAFVASLAAMPGKAKRGRPPATAVRRLTVGKMVEAWQSHGLRWQTDEDYALADRTKRDYRQKLKVLQDDFPQLWLSPAEAVSRPVLQNAYDKMVKTRGLATARGAIVVLGAAFKWAVSRGRIRMSENPAYELDRQMPKPRIRFGTRSELEALIAAADDLELPWVGDAIMLGLWTAQRQGDRLRLKHAGRIKNRRVFRQSKTGAIVHILEAPQLEARLTASAARRSAAGKIDPHVILNEATWRPYVEDTYRHDFAKVRAHAAGKEKDEEQTKKKGHPVWRYTKLASVATFHDQDLRDTAITWMALAGASIPEIASVSGHSVQGVYAIMKHYLATHPEMADTAIRKMVEWYEAGGETEIG